MTYYQKPQSAIMHLLGKGQYGNVYRGMNIKTKQEVAIKVIKFKTIGSDMTLLDCIFNEVHVQQSLQCRNVEVIQTEDDLNIMMEYCKDGDLRKFIESNGNKLPEDLAMNVLIDILSAFVELVEKGVVHRDLKPDNILMDKGVCKICDFGFAQAITNMHKTKLDISLGSPLYMGPQILQQQPYSSKQDIWSIGVIYYEILYGKTPWNGTSIRDLIYNIKSQPLQFSTTIKVSQKSQEFIRGCLQLDESKRLSFEEIFLFPMFNNCFGYKERLDQLSYKSEEALCKFLQQIQEKQYDIKTLLDEQLKESNSKTKCLFFDDVKALLLKIEPNLTREEIEYIFNRFDSKGKNQIQVDEFIDIIVRENENFWQNKYWLDKNEREEKMQKAKANNAQQVKEEKKQVDHNQSSELQLQFSDDEEEEEIEVLMHEQTNKKFPKEEFVALQQYCTHTNANIEELFNMFSSLKNKDSITLNDFQNMCQALEITNDIVKLQQLFCYFDVNNHAIILKQQFSKLLKQKIN